jgi:hypothetical protein
VVSGLVEYMGDGHWEIRAMEVSFIKQTRIKEG